MTRLTITLDDALHQALKEAAARQGRSIGKIIEEGLLLRGIKPMTSARDLVARARQQAGMDEADAIALAVEETRRHRARKERAPDGTAA
jgi:predicted transcriptional regulator